MNFRIKKISFLQNAIVLSTIAHGFGIYILMNWPTSQKLPSQKLEPIQITNVIVASPSNSKLKTELAPSIKPAKKVLTAFKKHQPTYAPLRRKKVQVQPVEARKTLGQIRRISFSGKKPKHIKPFKVQATQPAFMPKGMSVENYQRPRNSFRPVQVAKLTYMKSGPLQAEFQEGKFDSKSRLHDNSIQPVRSFGRVSLPENSSQRIMTVNGVERSNAIVNSKVKVRQFSHTSNSFVVGRGPVQEASRAIRTAYSNQIRPVQLASFSESFADGPDKGEMEKKFSPSPVSEQSAVVAPSSSNLTSLKKNFSSSIWRKIAKSKFYPDIAQRQGWEGKPVVEFQVGKNGDLLAYSVAEASPHEILNKAAIDAVKKASPYPKIPESLNLDSIRFKIPITFKLNLP
jgi:TonB family protein